MHQSTRPVWFPFSPVNTVVVLLLGGLLILGAGGCGGPGQPGPQPDDLLAGIPVSPDLSDDLDASRAFTASLPAEPDGRPSATAADLAIYERLVVAIQDPATREAAGDELYAAWRADPTNFLWIDLGAGYNYLLRRNTDRNAMYALPVLADTTTAIGAFVRDRRFYGYGSCGDHYRRAMSFKADLDPLQQLLLVRRYAVVVSDEGRHLAAVRLLLDELPKVRQVGGVTLAGQVWYDVARYLAEADRLDDALHAGHRAVQLAELGGLSYRAVQGRLELADILAKRREYDAALTRYIDLAAQAQASRFTWLAADALNRAAALHAALGDTRGALACDRENLALALAAGDSLNAPRDMMNLAHDFRLLGQLDSCRVYQQTARLWVEAFHDKRNRAALPYFEAEYYCQIGDYATADSLLQVSAGRMSTTGVALDEARLLLALVRQGLESYQPTVAYRALARLDALRGVLQNRWPDQNLQADLAIATAEFLGRQGEFQRAQQALEEAAAAVARHGGEGKVWEYERCRGELALLRRDPLTARAAFQRCVELADTAGLPDQSATSRFHLGRVLLDESDYAAARKLFADADAETEAETDTGFGGRFRTRISAELFLGSAYAREQAFVLAEDHLRRGLSRCTQRSPHDLLAAIHLELGRVLAATDRPIDAADHLQQAWRYAIDAVGRQQVVELHHLDHSLRRDVAEQLVGLYLDHPNLVTPAEPGPVTLDLALTALAPDRLEKPERPAAVPGATTALYFVGRQRSFVWVISATRVSVHDLPGRTDLAALTRSVLADMQETRDVPVWEAARRLGDILLAPVSRVWSGEGILRIAADDLLYLLPWPALPWPRSSDDAASDPRLSIPMLLIDQGPLVMIAPMADTGSDGAPSYGGSPAPGRRDLLAVGVDSEFAANGDRSDRPRLRHAEAEARHVAESWQGGATVLRTGTTADWSRIATDDLKRFAVLHLASHAVAYRGAPANATLRLAGAVGSSPLTLPDIHDLDLNAELVYLSCCEAAGAQAGAAGGLMAFAGAFLQAGAAAVIASPVKVDDAASAVLAERFYGHWQTGADLPAALRLAMCDLRDGTTDRDKETATERRWRHPYFWAFYRVIEVY